MNITKAKIKNRCLEVEYSEKNTFINPEGETINTEREYVAKCNDVCHDSLIAAFGRLKPHAVLIADLRQALFVEEAVMMAGSINDIELSELKNIEVNGFVVVGSNDDDSRGAMIMFFNKRNSRTVVINTPVVRFSDPDYDYCTELEMAISDCINEVEDYLNGKVAVRQTEMNFDEGFADDAQVVEQQPVQAEETPKKKHGRKMKISGVDVEVILTKEEVA